MKSPLTERAKNRRRVFAAADRVTGRNPGAAFSSGVRSVGNVALAFAVGLCLVCGPGARADSRTMASAQPGMVETGAPSFVVLGPEALGLSTAPIDLHLLPDGRVLVVSQHELAFSDGVRWEAFRAADERSETISSVAVDDDGRIYTAMTGGFARLDLGDGGQWRYVQAGSFPGEGEMRKSIMKSVAVLGNQWLWYGSIDAIVSWRPGQPARTAGHISEVDQVFALGDVIFVSNHSSGAFLRLKSDGVAEPVSPGKSLVSAGVTCAVPFGPGQLLVGTTSTGLKLFDGTTFRPFGPPGLLNSGHRITDLCPSGDGLYAAAVDTVGIVFFDHEGRTVQVLERSLDHRLARVRRLRYSRDGVLWALLNDGLARVDFPSPISHFEPLLASGLTYAEPLRHADKLWILADGRAMRGIYDPYGRLDRFEEDTPPGHFLFNLKDVDGQLFACNDAGIFVYETAGWRLILPGIMNARLGVAPSTKDGIFYAARGEYGVIQQTGQNYVARRIPLPALDNSYGAVIDAAGIGWLELGTSRVGRFDPHDGNPTLQIFGPSHGLADGWVELYLLDGTTHFHLADKLYRFDETKHIFLEDHELLARFPQLAVAGGRPIIDSFGRLWYTTAGAIKVVERSDAGGDHPVKIASVGFTPTNYTAEADGVVWIFEKRRLVRMDLRLAPPPPQALRAIITSVQFAASSRHLFSPGTNLEPLNYADNSLVFHFAAPANPFAAPLTFEVLLEGAGATWISTGTVGLAAFNRLKEGHYVFHVRPVTDGTVYGAEARLSFIVRPPWFRTPLAWCLYFAGAVGLLVFAAWLSSFLQRRENERLERLVSIRTGELNTTNEQLGRQIEETTVKSAALSVSEESYRLLSAELEQRVQTRTAELFRSHNELQQRELLFRLIFEHAPVGISWKRADLGSDYHLNSTFRRFLDLPGETLPDSSLLTAMIHPEDAHRQAEQNRLVASGRSNNYSVEHRYVRKDGMVVWGRLAVAVIRDADNRIIQAIGILEDITARKKAEQELADTYKNLVDVSRTAGMAEVATSVLHNVGNVLNSLNVSASVIATGLNESKADSLTRLADLLQENQADLAGFMTNNPKGQRVPEFIGTLARHFIHERDHLKAEAAALRNNVDHIREIVAMQQTYATRVRLVETLDATALMEDALRMNSSSLDHHEIRITRTFSPVPPVQGDKSKVLQIIINLIRNAKIACDDTGRADKMITLVIEPGGAGRVRLGVRDNGVGIPPENLERIFAHGFTTRKNGHGFGLHSAANAAREMNGTTIIASDGAGTGATFTLELPAAETAGTAITPAG